MKKARLIGAKANLELRKFEVDGMKNLSPEEKDKIKWYIDIIIQLLAIAIQVVGKFGKVPKLLLWVVGLKSHWESIYKILEKIINKSNGDTKNYS